MATVHYFPLEPSGSQPPDGTAAEVVVEEVEFELVDRRPDDYDPEVAEAFRVFARGYSALVAELFADDPDLRSPGVSEDAVDI